MESQMPQALNNYNLYLGDRGEKFIGAGQVEIPEISMLTTEVNMAGMAGKVNVPLTGQTDAFAVTVTAPVLTLQAVKAAIPTAQLITARMAIENYDAARGTKRIQPTVITMRGCQSALKPGSLEKGSAMDTSVSFEVDYLKITIDGQDVLEIDKWNNVYKVNGVDYLADVREAI
jgi:P2 family phage contractile tail tube protein